MARDRDLNDPDSTLDPEDVNSLPASDENLAAQDPNDEVPVPIAMSPAEIDERAQAVESLRAANPARIDDDSRLDA
jgi:hypothetical protein